MSSVHNSVDIRTSQFTTVSGSCVEITFGVATHRVTGNESKATLNELKFVFENRKKSQKREICFAVVKCMLQCAI